MTPEQYCLVRHIAGEHYPIRPHNTKPAPEQVFFYPTGHLTNDEQPGHFREVMTD